MKHLFTLLLLIAGLLIQTTGATAQETPATPAEQTPVEETYTRDQFNADLAKLKIENEKMGLMLGRTMPFVGMAFTILILVIVFGTMRRADRNRHETIRKYLELGIDVPEMLLIDPVNPQNKKPLSDKRKAIIWLSVGLGIAAMFYVLTGNQKHLAFAIIPLFVGIGYWVSAILIPEKPEDKR